MESEILAELRALRAEVADLKARVSAPRAGALTVAQVAARLPCSVRRVFELLESGELIRGRRAGRATTVTVASVEAFEQSGGGKAAPAPRAVPMPTEPFNADFELAELERLRRSSAVVERAPVRAGARFKRPKTANRL